MSKMDLSELQQAHKDEVAALVACKGYAKVSRAESYIETKLGPIWRPLLDLDDETPLVEQLDFTPTMSLAVHLFAKAVHKHGTTKLPVMMHWMPVVEGDHLRLPHAISKNDIAKIIGKSRSAVDEAIGRLRGKRERYEQLFDHRLACPLYVQTGIMLDVMTHPNLSFGFMFEDYETAHQLAEDARIRDGQTNNQQKVWCREALQTKTLPEMAKATEPSNTTTANAVGER